MSVRRPRLRHPRHLAAACLAMACAPSLAQASWAPADTLTPAGHHGEAASVAFADDGRAVVAWKARWDGVSDLHAEGRTWAGTGWGGLQGDVTLSSDSTHGMAFDAAATLHTINFRVVNHLGAPYAVRTTDGVWSVPVSLASGADPGIPGYDARLWRSGTLAVHARGAACATWGGANGAAQTATRGSAGAWSSPATGTSVPMPASASLSLLAGPNGCASAAYWNSAGTISVHDYLPLTGWGAARTYDPLGTLTTSPQLADDDAGRQTMIWTSRSGELARLWVAQREPNGPWGPARLVSLDDHDVFEPHLDVHPSGHVVVGWVSNRAAWVASKPLLGAWGPPERVSGASEDVKDIEVAAGSETRAATLWTRAQELDRVPVASVRSTKGWSTATRLSGVEARLKGKDFGIDVRDDGAAIATWSNDAVQARVFDPQPPNLTITEPATPVVAGQPARLTATADDALTGIAGEVRWKVDEVAVGTGANSTYTFPAAGSYTVHAEVSDVAGNVTVARQVVRVDAPPAPSPPTPSPPPTTTTATTTTPVVAPPPAPTPTTPTPPTPPPATVQSTPQPAPSRPITVTSVDNAGLRWHAGRLRGSVIARGQVVTPQTVVVSVRAISGTAVRLQPALRDSVVAVRRVPVTAGPLNVAVTIPSDTLPGVYRVEVTGITGVLARVPLTIGPPRIGIVQGASLTASHRGRQGARLTARFRFAVAPHPRTRVTTQWLAPPRSGIRMTPESRGAGRRQVTAYIQGPLPRGLWRCVLRVNGVVVRVAETTL